MEENKIIIDKIFSKMKFYELRLNLSGKGQKSSYIAGPSPGYFPNGNQGDIPLDEFVNEVDIVFDKLIFSGGKRVHVTDFISHDGVNGLGYVISERIKNLLQDFNLPEHRFYKLPVYQDSRGKQHQYYKLHMLQHYFDYSLIDFEKSSFYIGDFFKKNKKIVKYQNEQELIIKLKNLDDLEERIWGNKIVLNHNYEKQGLDCFHIHHFSDDFIISERLRESLEQIEATGINYEECSFECKGIVSFRN